MTATIQYADDEYNICLNDGADVEETGWRDLPEGSIDLIEDVKGKHFLAILEGYDGDIPENSVFELKPLDVSIENEDEVQGGEDEDEDEEDEELDGD